MRRTTTYNSGDVCKQSTIYKDGYCLEHYRQVTRALKNEKIKKTAADQLSAELDQYNVERQQRVQRRQPSTNVTTNNTTTTNNTINNTSATFVDPHQALFSATPLQTLEDFLRTSNQINDKDVYISVNTED